MGGGVWGSRSCSLTAGEARSSKLLEYILRPHVEKARGMYVCTKSGIDTQSDVMDVDWSWPSLGRGLGGSVGETRWSEGHDRLLLALPALV